MGLFSQLAGTMASFFQIGGPGGPGLNDNAGAIEAKNSSNSAFAILRAATPVGDNDAAVKSYVDTQPKPLIASVQFNGGSALPANSATEKFYVVTTSGANASIGQLLWDDGSGVGTVTVLGAGAGWCIVTPNALSGGTISFAANTIYTWSGSAWVSTASSITGAVQMIRIPIGTATVNSATVMPVGAVVIDAGLDITAPYTVGATIALGTPAVVSQFQTTSDNDPQAVNLYTKEQDTVVNSSPATLQATITGASAGAGFAYVTYSASPNN